MPSRIRIHRRGFTAENDRLTTESQRAQRKRKAEERAEQSAFHSLRSSSLLLSSSVPSVTLWLIPPFSFSAARGQPQNFHHGRDRRPASVSLKARRSSLFASMVGGE